MLSWKISYYNTTLKIKVTNGRHQSIKYWNFIQLNRIILSTMPFLFTDSPECNSLEETGSIRNKPSQSRHGEHPTNIPRSTRSL